ncbi:MAG: hypothetical protein ACI89W_000271 [Gammaproteobacteria bacterium]|jgi:hypothetical protein
MTVNFKLPKKILVVHGVQTGTDSELTQNIEIEDNLKRQLAGANIDYSTEMFRYESINDKAQASVRNALAALTGNKLVELAVDAVVDIAGDVILALKEGEAYNEIKQKLKDKIIANYEAQQPLYIVAHSLGTIYSFDAVNDLMKEIDIFKFNQKETNPVQGLITLGSPLSLDLFARDYQNMANLIPEDKTIDDDTSLFPWHNYYDPTDPVVSGNLAGLSFDEAAFANKFREKTYNMAWDVRSRKVISGKAYIAAHSAYWNDRYVGDGIKQMLIRG